MKLKGIALFFVACCLCFSLLGCGKSKSVIRADNLIMKIGEVTLDSKPNILVAEASVKALTEKQKTQLENLAVLENARAEYDLLVENKIAEVQNIIDSIGTVTLDSGKEISRARAAFNGSLDEVKAGISNYEVLRNAEIEFEALLSSERMENVTNLIDQIGVVTLDSEAAIHAADEAWKLLPYEEKYKIENLSVLENARTELKNLKLQNAVATLVSYEDKVEGTTWYHAKSEPYYANIRCYLLPYIGRTTSGAAWLRLKALYTGDSWVFYDCMKIYIDGETFTRTFEYGDVEHDNGSGDVWEVADVSPTDNDIELLKKIANSEETIIRFKGDSRQYDFTVPQADKNGILDVLNAYEVMNSINE